MKTLGIIPARFASTRFPGKPLAVLGGKTIIRRVYERAAASAALNRVVVATDDDRIAGHVRTFGGEVMLTDPGHPSGTDRCAEVARQLNGFDLVVNIQGDEPFVEPGQIGLIVRMLQSAEQPIATLAKRIEKITDLDNPNVVKVVFSSERGALYFSRSAIPHLRGVPRAEQLATGALYKHIGLYGFRRAALLAVTALAPGAYERWESLEQLRWLENGYEIAVAVTDRETIGIDTPEDLKRAEKYLQHE